MSTSATPPLVDFGEKISNLEKRFEDLKKELEKQLNEFSAKVEQLGAGGITLQESVKALATAQEETIKKLNVCSDEVRVIGGKIVNRPQDPAPVTDVKKEMGLSMFDLFED